jgi:hypothetical protein
VLLCELGSEKSGPFYFGEYMSVTIDPKEITLWYKLKEDDWAKCRKDLLVFNYQAQTITTSYDHIDVGIAIIVTAPFDQFQMECP